MSAALLIVDMQNIFLRQASHLIEKTQELAESWPEDRLYWLQYRNHPDSLFEKHLNWSAAVVSPEIDLIEGKGQNRKIIHYGYAPPPDFIAELKTKYNQAYICGVDTDACVYAAMMTLWDNEIRPVLLADYCASSGGRSFHDAAMALMQRQFGTESILSGKPF